MAGNTLEIELSDEQIDKVNKLEEYGIGIGDAIDMLFEIRERALVDGNEYLDKKIDEVTIQKENLKKQIETFDKELDLYNELKENWKDGKFEIWEKTSEPDDTYDVKVQHLKHKVSWAKDFFNF